MNEKKLYYQRVWELTEINCGEIQMIEKRGQAIDFVLSKPKLSTILNTENKKSLLYYLPQIN